MTTDKETSRHKAYYKVVMVIYSCKTKDHIEGARNMVENFKKLFPDTTFNHSGLTIILNHKAKFVL